MHSTHWHRCELNAPPPRTAQWQWTATWSGWDCRSITRRAAAEVVCQLDTLPVIHVAGSKGKGSTCAFCDSMLRKHGKRSTTRTPTD